MGQGERRIVIEPKPEKPRVVDVAVKLLYGTLLVGLVRIALELPTLATLPAAASAFTAFVILFTFAILGWLTYMIDQGRNWARITMLVLELIGLPFSLGPMWERLKTAPASGVLEALQTTAQVIALVLLFLPAARSWFRLSNRLLPSAVH
jgi:hypothetical protein